MSVDASFGTRRERSRLAMVTQMVLGNRAVQCKYLVYPILFPPGMVQDTLAGSILVS